MAKVLVVGGAGYVGSAVVSSLIDQGHHVWVLDNLTTGHPELVLGHGFTIGNAGDFERVSKLLDEHSFDAVMHFAAKSIVPESFEDPEGYFENNVTQTQSLVKAMINKGIKRFVFSSTASVYGDPGDASVSESFKKNPVNPYGETKLAIEKHLEEQAKASGLKSIALRYFNAAGAEEKLRVGEWHEPETHLIPNIVKAALDHLEVKVFGLDYPTPDGTCIRDYVYVGDLAQAHLKSLEKLLSDTNSQGSFKAYNLGSEKGYSVSEILKTAREVTGINISQKNQGRRAGDPARLVADASLAKKELGYQPSQDALEKVIRTAWLWEKKRREPAKAVFLDRDGTINFDPGYLNSASLMNLLPGVGEALAKLQRAGFKLVVVSNQSGVARGKIDEAEIPKIHARLDELLAPFGAKIQRYQLCFHHPDTDCPCRKPKPNLILDSARGMNIDVSRSYMVGDKVTDVEAGRAAGCKAVALVRTGDGKESENLLGKVKAPNFVGDGLSQVADWILNQK